MTDQGTAIPQRLSESTTRRVSTTWPLRRDTTCVSALHVAGRFDVARPPQRDKQPIEALPLKTIPPRRRLGLRREPKLCPSPLKTRQSRATTQRVSRLPRHQW